jgi:hypothetical protein
VLGLHRYRHAPATPGAEAIEEVVDGMRADDAPFADAQVSTTDSRAGRRRS